LSEPSQFTNHREKRGKKRDDINNIIVIIILILLIIKKGELVRRRGWEHGESQDGRIGAC